MYAAGRSYERKLPAKALEQLRRHLEELAGDAGAVQWEASGQFGTSLLLQTWPPDVPAPQAAYLRRARVGQDGFELVVEWGEPQELEAMASLLSEALAQPRGDAARLVGGGRLADPTDPTRSAGCCCCYCCCCCCRY